MNEDTRHRAPILRRFALLLDGMTRSMLLPLGPLLVHRLVSDKKEVPTIMSPILVDVVYSLALVLASFAVGRSFGSSLGTRISVSRITVSRIGSIVLSLNVFTFGLTSIQWLVVTRLLSGLLVGMLISSTKSIHLQESAFDHFETAKRSYADVVETKLFLTGFALSMLSGSLLFYRTSFDSAAQFFTGSIIFLAGVAVAGEILLRYIFSLQLWDETDVSVARRRTVDFGSQDMTMHYEPKVIDEDAASGRDEEDDVFFLDPVKETPSGGGFASPAPRMRIESMTSVDEFYDCRSVFSDMSDMLLGSPTMDPREITRSELASYLDHRCVYPDGSPAYVPQGDKASEVPSSYIDFYKGDRSRAQHAWEATQRWRFEKRVWKIHTIPNRWFSRIKEAYPHFVHGHSKAGYPIIYEQPGRMNLKELFRNGCEIADMVHHYTFFMEYVSNCICTREEIRSRQGPDRPSHSSSTWGILVVMDVKGAGLSHLSGDVVKYLKQAGDINSAHYPNSMKRAFLVNSPFWLAGAWSGIKGILPDSVQVDILSESKYPKALREYIDEDQIPPEYGGSSPYCLGEHPYEVELRALVDKAAEGEDDDGVGDVECALPRFVSTPHVEAENSSTDVDMSASRRMSEPLRRRVGSTDRPRRRTFSGQMYSKGKKSTTALEVLMTTSIILSVFNAVQGALELAVPIWLLTTTVHGGLGYSSIRSGVTMFSASIVLLWLLRRKSFGRFSCLPAQSPMRAFRIGVGTLSVVCVALGFISTKTSPQERTDSVSVMTSAVISFSCISTAIYLGVHASKNLHMIAADRFSRDPMQSNRFTNTYGFQRFVSDCESGRFTSRLCLVAEVAGLFIAALIMSISFSSGLSAPFEAGDVVLLIASLLCLVLYSWSFSLHFDLNSGELTFTSDRCFDGRRKCLPFIGEALVVSAGDMASLLEESHWSSTPLLGRTRRRTLSSTSNISLSERGEIRIPMKNM